MAELELYLVVDSNGDYVVAGDYDSCLEAFDNEIGGHQPRRVIRIDVTATLPKAEEAIKVDVPDAEKTADEASATEQA